MGSVHFTEKIRWWDAISFGYRRRFEASAGWLRQQISLLQSYQPNLRYLHF